MTELGPEGRALLDAARDADSAEMNASRERVRSALGRKLGVAAVGFTTATAASTATAGLFTKVVIGLAALGVVAGGVAVTRSEKAPAPVVVAKPIAVTPRALPEPTPPVATAAPVVAITEPAPSASAPVTKPSVSAPRPAPSLSDELAALQSANEKLAAGKPGETLAILDAMPKAGTLGEERAGLRLLARCALAQPGAPDAARAFLLSHPESPLAARLKSSCGID
ncbi:MAG: hypothetical protein ACXWUE_41020 [Polyangiales bacterium]